MISASLLLFSLKSLLGEQILPGRRAKQFQIILPKLFVSGLVTRFTRGIKRAKL